MQPKATGKLVMDINEAAKGNFQDDREQPLIFVGGPIQHAIIGAGMVERAESPIRKIHFMVQSFDLPFVSAHVAEAFGETTNSFTPDEVTHRDYNWMRQCNLFVAVLPSDEHGRLIRTDGTHIELGWAAALGKPIIILAHSDAHSQLSHLVKGLSTVANCAIVPLERVVQRSEILRQAIVDRLGAGVFAKREELVEN
ncbi:conserved hypothetical protein [Agrobacterium genomosp. 5 str. CFBP 6626]|nr:conserved hypothetical protein [Agrobacterium genomosp. 5 str. CFBP 6626]